VIVVEEIAVRMLWEYVYIIGIGFYTVYTSHVQANKTATCIIILKALGINTNLMIFFYLFIHLYC